VSAPLAQRHYFAHHGVAAIIVSTTPRPAGLIGTDDDQILINGELLSTFSTFIRNTSPASSAGLPSVSLPAAITGEGLPFSGLVKHRLLTRD
jgi:indoleacetamide hydrolase